MRNKEIRALIAALHEARDYHYLSMRGMARRMGYSSGHLSMVLSGKRKPSMRFMEAAVQAFPQVRHRLCDSLADDPTNEDISAQDVQMRGRSPPCAGADLVQPCAGALAPILPVIPTAILPPLVG